MVYPHDDNDDAPRVSGDSETSAVCPECMGPVTAISLWWLRCTSLKCRTRTPRYKWVAPVAEAPEQITLFREDEHG